MTCAAAVDIVDGAATAVSTALAFPLVRCTVSNVAAGASIVSIRVAALMPGAWVTGAAAGNDPSGWGEWGTAGVCRRPPDPRLTTLVSGGNTTVSARCTIPSPCTSEIGGGADVVACAVGGSGWSAAGKCSRLGCSACAGCSPGEGGVLTAVIALRWMLCPSTWLSSGCESRAASSTVAGLVACGIIGLTVGTPAAGISCAVTSASPLCPGARTCSRIGTGSPIRDHKSAGSGPIPVWIMASAACPTLSAARCTADATGAAGP